MKTPDEPRSFSDEGVARVDSALRWDGRDRADIQTFQPEDADFSLGEEERYGSLKQNRTTHWQVQDR